MSVKRYSSSCVKFTANIKVGGKQVPLVFDRYNQEQKRRFIDVSDPAIQRQLDKDPGLNTYFRRDFVVEDLANAPDDLIVAEYTPEIMTEDKIKTFSTNVEAKTWINQNFKIPYSRIVNKEQLTNEYALLGLELRFTTI